MANFFILDSSSVETPPYVVITEFLEQSSVTTLTYINVRQGGRIRCVLIKDLDKGKRVRRVLSPDGTRVLSEGIRRAP